MKRPMQPRIDTMRTLRQRGLAKDVPGYPGVVGMTAKGMRELDARLGLTPKDLDEASRHFRRYSDNQHQGPFNPHITGALLRRFVGKNLAGKDILDLGCVDWDHLVNPRHGSVKPLTATLMMNLAEAGANAYGLDVRDMELPYWVRTDVESRMHFKRGTIQQLGRHFKGRQFDAVVAIDVLTTKGLRDPGARFKQNILRGLAQKLRSGGHVVIQNTGSANEESLFTREDFERAGFVVRLDTRAGSIMGLTPASTSIRGRPHPELFNAYSPKGENWPIKGWGPKVLVATKR